MKEKSPAEKKSGSDSFRSWSRLNLLFLQQTCRLYHKTRKDWNRSAVYLHQIEQFSLIGSAVIKQFYCAIKGNRKTIWVVVWDSLRLIRQGLLTFYVDQTEFVTIAISLWCVERIESVFVWFIPIFFQTWKCKIYAVLRKPTWNHSRMHGIDCSL